MLEAVAYLRIYGMYAKKKNGVTQSNPSNAVDLIMSSHPSSKKMITLDIIINTLMITFHNSPFFLSSQFNLLVDIFL